MVTGLICGLHELDISGSHSTAQVLISRQDGVDCDTAADDSLLGRWLGGRKGFPGQQRVQTPAPKAWLV
jgi:hypothetical protein